MVPQLCNASRSPLIDNNLAASGTPGPCVLPLPPSLPRSFSVVPSAHEPPQAQKEPPWCCPLSPPLRAVFFPYLPTSFHRKRDAARKQLHQIFGKIIRARRDKGVKEDDMLQVGAFGVGGGGAQRARTAAGLWAMLGWGCVGGDAWSPSAPCTRAALQTFLQGPCVFF